MEVYIGPPEATPSAVLRRDQVLEASTKEGLAISRIDEKPVPGSDRSMWVLSIEGSETMLQFQETSVAAQWELLARLTRELARSGVGSRRAPVVLSTSTRREGLRPGTRRPGLRHGSPPPTYAALRTRYGRRRSGSR